MKKINREDIFSNKVAKGRGPFPQAVRFGPFLFVSGMGPLVKETNAPIVGGTFEDQVHLTLTNIKNVAEEAGYSLSDAARLTIYLTDLANIPRFNKIYEEYFRSERPARALVQVGLRGIDVEIEATFIKVNELESI